MTQVTINQLGGVYNYATNSENCLYTDLINAFSPTASICEQQQSFTTAKDTLYSVVEKTTKNRCRFFTLINLNGRRSRARIEKCTLTQLKSCENCQELKTIIQQYCISISKCHYDQNGNTNALIHTLFTAFMYAHTDRLEIPHHVYLNAIPPSTTSTQNRAIGINKNTTAQSDLDKAFNCAFERHVTRALNHRMQGFDTNNQEVLVGKVDYWGININGFGAAIPTNSKYVRMGNFGTDGELKGLGSIHWHHGGFDCGQFYRGALEGYGVRIVSDGSYDKGMFKSGTLNGKGVRTCPSQGGGNEIQTGTFEDGKLKNGSTTFYNKDGSSQIQTGIFGDEKLKDGSITFYNKDGSTQIQTGTFEDGKLKDGSIIHYNEDGTFREQKGSFVDLKLKGAGVTKTTNADRSYQIQTGTFEDGEFKNGYITFHNEDGSVQKKQHWEFLNSPLTGKGTITYKNGATEEGCFTNGKLNGEGVRTFPELGGGCQIQTGTFEDGKFKSGTTEERHFSHKQFTYCGVTKIINADGSYQIQNGMFEYGEFTQGWKTFYTKDGIFQKQQNWEFFNPRSTCKGSINYDHGFTEQGYFANEMLNGEGVRSISIPGGGYQTQTGIFEDGKLKSGSLIICKDGSYQQYYIELVNGKFNCRVHKPVYKDGHHKQCTEKFIDDVIVTQSLDRLLTQT